MCLRGPVLARLILPLLLVLCPASHPADNHNVAVLYPATQGVYREIFDALVRGITATLGTENARTFVVSEQTTPVQLKSWLTQQSPRAVITLGRDAYEGYRASGFSANAISGALDLSPQLDPEARGVSLSVAPELFFETLRRLTPSVNRVYVVYDPAKNQWIIDRARAVAGQFGIEITPFKAANLAEATRHYRAILTEVRPDKAALWLPFDSALIDERSVLPVIIEQSWYRRVVVFSNSLVHARLGALFALYPDPEPLGARLAKRALGSDLNHPSGGPAIEPLQDVKRALNVRFARHLEVDVRRLSDEFDVYFPSANAQ